MIDHAEVRDRLEIAAVEPDGLDRVMAGDTPEAIALASHLAGCPSCLDELGRLREASAILRDVITSELPAELRDRTLAFVREVGVPRGPRFAPAPVSAAVGGLRAEAAPGSIGVAEAPEKSAGARTAARGGEPVDLFARRRAIVSRGRLLWVASIAAAVVLSVVGTTAFLGSSVDEDGLALAKVATWSVELAGEPDTHHIALTSTAGSAGGASGELAYSPTSNDLVVIARGLPAAPSGSEYRCWLETAAGERTRIGRMALAYGIFYWVGDVPNLADLPAGTRFGVSLEDQNSSGGTAPSLVGQL
jgi:hypothetical protein